MPMIDLTVEARALDDSAQAAALVLRAEGTAATPEDAFRIWVILDEVAEGGWGAPGRIWRFHDIATYVTSASGKRTSSSAATAVAGLIAAGPAIGGTP